jgi:hypothetical protein
MTACIRCHDELHREGERWYNDLGQVYCKKSVVKFNHHVPNDEQAFVADLVRQHKAPPEPLSWDMLKPIMQRVRAAIEEQIDKVPIGHYVAIRVDYSDPTSGACMAYVRAVDLGLCMGKDGPYPAIPADLLAEGGEWTIYTRLEPLKRYPL